MSTPDPKPLTADDVMLASEVAELLRIPVQSVHAYARGGKLPSQKVGRHRRFLRADVEAVMRGGSVRHDLLASG
jgi:excisionase family DNA binding protein